MARVPQYNNPGLPSNLYAGAAVKIDTRPLANILYQEQKFQEARQQKEAENLDNEMKSNVAKIRDADVPDYINNYQNYANITKQILFDPKLKRDPQALAQAQIARGKAYAAAQGLANASSNLRSNFDALDKDRFVHPNNYTDDYFSKRSVANKLPISKLQGIDIGQKDETGKPILMDLTNPESYLYKNQYDPTKLLTTAKGEKLTNEVDEGPTDKTGLQNKITTYQFYGNKPNEFKATILNGMAGDRNANRFFTNQLKNTSPEEIAKINEQYNAIPASVWKQMGINKEELKVEHPDNQADIAATYLAQKHAIENIPRAIKTDVKTNEAVKMRMNQSFDLTKIGIEHTNRLVEKQAKDGGATGGIPDLIQNAYQEAVDPNAIGGGKKYQMTVAGQPQIIYKANVNPELRESFAYKYPTTNAQGNASEAKVYPSEIAFTKDGKYTIPLFYTGRNDKDGNPIVDLKKSVPIATDFIRAKEAKKNFGVKGAAAVMRGQGASPKQQKYTYEGKTYTHDELNKSGYSDNEIDKAIKAGIIK